MTQQVQLAEVNQSKKKVLVCCGSNITANGELLLLPRQTESGSRGIIVVGSGVWIFVYLYCTCSLTVYLLVPVHSYKRSKNQ